MRQSNNVHAMNAMRDNSPLRGPTANEAMSYSANTLQSANNNMRTQPTKVELGLEHGNTYEQAQRARPFEYVNSFTQGSVAYPYQPAVQDLSSQKPTHEE